MSILSVTLVSAALLGAGPDGVQSEFPAAATSSPPGRAFVVVASEEAECPVAPSVIPHGDSGDFSQSEYPAEVNSVVQEGCLEDEFVPTGWQPNAVCDAQYGAYSGNYCENGGGEWCPYCEDDDCEPCCWDRHIINYCIGPGDLYPHYPYLPVYHGYYYFRPYNFEHVLRDKAVAAQMGGDPRAPYSVAFLKRYFPPAPIEHVPIAGLEAQLPLMEDLLGPEPLVAPQPPPIPPNPNTIPVPAPDIPMPRLDENR